MAGISGILAFDPSWNVSRFLYFSLLALQHRGQEEACAYVFNGEKIEWICGKGLVEEVLTPLSSMHGWAGIGGVWSESLHAYAEGDVSVAVVLDGRIFDSNVEKLAMRASTLLADDPFEGMKKLWKEFKGAYSALFLTSKGEVIAFRSPPGLRPLQVGAFGFDMITFASESCAFDVIGSDLRKDLDPGEVIYSSQLYTDAEIVERAEKVVCAFEYIYTARPDSVIDGIEVYKFREEIGRELAKLYKVKADTVVGVPETALPFAIGYSKEAKMPYSMGFVSTGRKTRTAIRPTLIERLMGVQLKLNPIRSTFALKDVLIIDDSMVRGITLKTVIQNLKNKVGVKRVKVLVGSPKIISHCPYGVEVPPADELIASKMKDEEIAKYIGAERIAWLPVERLREKLPNACFGCFTGKYPHEEEGA